MAPLHGFACDRIGHAASYPTEHTRTLLGDGGGGILSACEWCECVWCVSAVMHPGVPSSRLRPRWHWGDGTVGLKANLSWCTWPQGTYANGLSGFVLNFGVITKTKTNLWHGIQFYVSLYIDNKIYMLTTYF